LGEGEVVGGQLQVCVCAIRKIFALSLIMWPQFAISLTLKSTGSGSVWAKFGEEGATDVSV